MRQVLAYCGIIAFLQLCSGTFPWVASSSLAIGKTPQGRTEISDGYPSGSGDADQEFHTSVPQTWGDLRTLEVPLADADHSPVEVSWEFYYRVPWRPIYKSYPVYAPGHEPPGYFDWLKQQEPQVIWGIDSEGASHKPSLRTELDWIKAGEMVFDAPITYDTDSWGSSVVKVEDVRDPAWYQATGTPAGTDGTVPFARYVVRKKGVVELGQQSCGMCHTRVMPDRTFVKGAQGNFPFDRAAAFDLLKLASENKDKGKLLANVHLYLRSSFGAPWLQPEAELSRLTLDDVVRALEAIPPGVIDRGGSSIFSPVQTPDLIGVKDRHYLDHTGVVQQRSIDDLMRYAALNQDMKGLARYGDFVPEGINFRTLPAPTARSRYLDEELYALALYIYSLKPPSNPNHFDGIAERGRRVFEREGCARCHTPPLYTNNKLTLAEGFTPPAEEIKDFEILLTSVGTDPNLALRTRRGTGFYKVPSLKGVWYRGMFPHDGSCATLEDWFDARRQRDDYVPTGFKGFRVRARAVKGHPFGLNLSPEDKTALIKFLKTL
jgi:hypothetical protein